MTTNSPFFHEIRAGQSLEKIDKEVCICGCGTIGANLAETLARMGLQQMRLIDFDRIDKRNISCQPWLLSDVGQYKTKILSNMLYRISKCKAEAICERLTEQNAAKLLNGSDLIIDCFDNSAARKIVQDCFLESILHIGFSGDGYGEIIWKAQYKIPNENSTINPCDYPLTRPLMHLIVGIATKTITNYLLSGEIKNFTVTLNDFKISQF